MNPKTKPTDMGMNRTGIATSPIDSKKTIEGAVQGVPSASHDTSQLEQLRASISSQMSPVGTMPPPATLKGMAKSAMEALKGQKATVFLDKLGERLAFERGGVRLYDALLCKYDAANVHAGGPSRAELEKIKSDELQHFGMLVRAIERLGADPTAMTPSADIVGVMSTGLMQVLTDPRTTFSQGLCAILTAELSDNAGWELLIQMADGIGQDELASQFRVALAEEAEHLANVRRWIQLSSLGQAGVDVSAATATPPPPVR